MTNTKEIKESGLAYEVVIKPAIGPERKPNIESPGKEITKEIVDKKLVEAAHRRNVSDSFFGIKFFALCLTCQRFFQLLVDEKREKVAAEIEHVKKVNHIRSEHVETKIKEVAEKLEEKRKIIEAKQEAARLELERQRQAKQERLKDVLKFVQEKEELLVKVV